MTEMMKLLLVAAAAWILLIADTGPAEPKVKPTANIAQDRSGVVAVQMALLSPLIGLLIMSGVYVTVNSAGFYNATTQLCINMQTALAAADPPGPVIDCAIDPSPSMAWPL